jgi:glycerophosphoryl diester phosphodiesterase
MKKIIAHRANLQGKDANKENTIKQIKECIKLGFDVEIDIRTYKNKLYLGHDETQEKISLNFLVEYKKKLWVHCKDFDSFNFMIGKDLNYFWHQKDDFTLTSKKIIWTYPKKIVDKNSVIVCLSKKDTLNYKQKELFGICTDWCYI